MEVTDNKVIHLDPDKERLVIRFNCLLRAETMQHIQDEMQKQYETGVVVLPAYCSAFVVKKASYTDFQFPEVMKDD